MLPCLGQKNVSLSPGSSSLPLCLPPSFAAPTRAPSSTPIRWLCALSYLLNSTAQETSHPHFPVSSHPTPLRGWQEDVQLRWHPESPAPGNLNETD